MKIRRKGCVLRAYDVGFKKEIILYAEENGVKKAHQRYGVSEANIKRWKRLKLQIFENAIYNKDKLRVRKPIDYTAIKIDKSLYRKNANKLDSMPLMDRILKPSHESRSQQQQQKAQVLKSQPLSPTKLKVTRQGPKVAELPPLPPLPPPPAEVTPVNEEMCLRWNSHHANMQTAFPNILLKEQYVDCTLAAEGKTLKCHRMILSSCSPYFEEILCNISPSQHPVIFMKDIPFWILRSLCDFMYAGEVHIYQNKLQELLTVAEILKIKGLAGKSSNDNQETPTMNRDDHKINNNNNGNIKDERNKQKKTNYHHYHQFKSERLINIPPLLSSSSSRGDYDNDDVLDPLDLLEPLYEEIAEEKKTIANFKLQQKDHHKNQQQLIKKQLPKKIKKRKFPEQRDPSPPPAVFSFRKGTRSRPNVKIPKYYHNDYDNPKPSTSSQSQSQQQQSDPLLDVEDIKTEPIDVEDNNLSDYNDGIISPIQLTPSSGSIIPSCIEISPQYHNNNTTTTNDKFRKIKLTKQPIISNVHSIDDDYYDNHNHDDDHNNDITTPLGGLEVIKITMEGGNDEDMMAVTDDVDDNDSDDENSKSPLPSQINHDDLVPTTEPLKICSNNESLEITQTQQQDDDVVELESQHHNNHEESPPIAVQENLDVVIAEQSHSDDHERIDQISIN